MVVFFYIYRFRVWILICGLNERFSRLLTLPFLWMHLRAGDKLQRFVASLKTNAAGQQARGGILDQDPLSRDQSRPPTFSYAAHSFRSASKELEVRAARRDSTKKQGISGPSPVAPIDRGDGAGDIIGGCDDSMEIATDGKVTSGGSFSLTGD